VFVLDMNPITKALEEIESFYIDYYKEHWEKLLSYFHNYMLDRGFLAEYKGNVRTIFS